MFQISIEMLYCTSIYYSKSLLTLLSIWAKNKNKKRKNLKEKNVIVAGKKQKASISCEDCAFGLSELSGRVTELANCVKNVEGEVTKTVETLAQASQKAKKVLDKIVTVKKSMASSKEDTVNAAKKALSIKLREREVKKVNVVIYGREEAGANITQGRKRKEHDMGQLADMLNQTLKPKQVLFCFRKSFAGIPREFRGRIS